MLSIIHDYKSLIFYACTVWIWDLKHSLLQAFARLSALSEQRGDAYANADARVSLERMFQRKYNAIILLVNLICFSHFSSNFGVCLVRLELFAEII